MRTKLVTLFVLAITYFATAQAPNKIWFDESNLRVAAIHNFSQGRYLDCIVNCQRLTAQGEGDGLIYGLMTMAYDSIYNAQAATNAEEQRDKFAVDSSVLRRLAAADLSAEIYKRDLLQKAAAAYNKADYATSENNFAEYLKVAPKDTFANFYIANAQFYQGKYESALVYYKRVLELDFQRPDVHNLAGVCYMLQNNFLTARDYFSQAILLDKTMGVAYVNLGKVQYGLNDRQAALQNLNEGYTYAPKDSGIIAMLANLYVEQNDFANAEKFLAKLYALNKSNEAVGWNLVDIAYKAKDYKHAAAYLQNIIHINPKNPQAYNKLSEAYILQNDYESAFNNYEKAIEKLGESRDFLYGAGMCANHIGLYGKAIEHLSKAALLDANFASTYRELGNAYLKLKNKKDGKKNLKQAEALERGNPQSLATL